MRRLLLVVLLAACGSSQGPPPCDLTAQVDGEPDPTFANLQSRVFPSCTFTSCHQPPAHGDPPGHAIISSSPALAQTTYTNLINQPAVGPSSQAAPSVPLRVVPGDPQHSYLLWKIVGHDPSDAGVAVSGARMPQDCTGDGCLDCTSIRLVRRWILANAPSGS